MGKGMPSLGGALGSFNKSYLYLGIIVGWIIFGSLNQLQNAQEDCCKTGGCGTGVFYKISWWSSMGIATISTIIIVIPWLIYLGEAIMTMLV
jgi:hypothetical protein